MRQVRIRVTCDPCQAWHDAETEEGVQTVPVAGGQTLDLCPSHREDLQPFLALVAEWGATPQRDSGSRRTQAPSSGAVAPAEPGKAANRRGGKRARARRANAEQQAPTTAPVVAVDLPLVCELCRKPQTSSDSLGAHLRQQHSTTIGAVYGTVCPLCGDDGVRGRHLHQHGVTGGMPVAFLVAQQQGDPSGVLAARAAALAQ